MNVASLPDSGPPSATVVAVILAAGLGKRFPADRPKVLMPFRGRPLVHWVTAAVHSAGIRRVLLVIGHRGEMVQEAYSGEPMEFVWQRERLGTGHAVLQTEPLLCNHHGEILVLLGDAPCIRSTTITDLLTAHVRAGAAATILSAEVENPSGYGRVVRAADGTVDRVVEHRDADETLRMVREINSGAICFRAELLFPALHRVSNANDQGEYYLTDAIAVLRGDGHKVIAYRAADPHEVLGVNSPEELASLEALT
jgi:bifunctional UDP-N-acetylglucosamine pyrophosphorylase/glucosamine-1-phosphate N-acetyltransferase